MKLWTMLGILLISASAQAGNAVAATTVKAEATTKAAPKQESIQPAPKPQVIDTLIFTDTKPTEIGTLTWKNGRFEFKGKADRSARLFFDRYLKQIVDAYLKEKGCPGQ